MHLVGKDALSQCNNKQLITSHDYALSRNRERLCILYSVKIKCKTKQLFHERDTASCMTNTQIERLLQKDLKEFVVNEMHVHAKFM